jgi:tyrosyl-tRNA synthetase
MWRYYELCSNVSLDTLEKMKGMVRSGELHPKKAKEGLAVGVIKDFYDEAVAMKAREEFERVFQKHGLPDDVPEYRFQAEGGRVFLPKLLTEIGLASSRSEVNRLLKQGAVNINGQKVAPGTIEIQVEPGEMRLFKVGKRRFARVRFE